MVVFHYRKRDMLKRQLFVKSIIRKNVLKSLLCNGYYSTSQRWMFYRSFVRISSDATKAKFKHGCCLTTFSRSIKREFKVSRHKAKELMYLGYLVGLRKAS